RRRRAAGRSLLRARLPSRPETPRRKLRRFEFVQMLRSSSVLLGRGFRLTPGEAIVAMKDVALERAVRRFDEGEFSRDLARRVAIPTESQNPARGDAMREYVDGEMRATFERLGFVCAVLPNPKTGGPFFVAERIEGESLPTILSYGHGDVVLGMEGKWRGGLSPWTLTRDGDRWYGRGTADNKGQHSINIAALAAVLEMRGKLGFNCKFLIETG